MNTLKPRAYLLGLALALLCLILSGCGSMCQTLYPNQCGKTTPEIVYVSSYEQEEELPLPDRPTEESKAVDATGDGWREWLIVFGQDHLRVWAWALEMEHVIRSHNAAIPPPPPAE